MEADAIQLMNDSERTRKMSDEQRKKILDSVSQNAEKLRSIEKGDVALLREYLPETFFNIRLNPVEIQRYTSEELRQNITERVKASGDDLTRTGLCCVNMDKDVSDERIHEIFTIADEIVRENKARATE